MIDLAEATVSVVPFRRFNDQVSTGHPQSYFHGFIFQDDEQCANMLKTVVHFFKIVAANLARMIGLSCHDQTYIFETKYRNQLSRNHSSL